MKVLFIVGKGRSGSTLLDLLLNRLDGWFGMGEFDRIWVKVRDDLVCGCGERVVDCTVWGDVIREVLTRHRGCDPDDTEALRRAAADVHLESCRVLSYRELPRLWFAPHARRPAIVARHIDLMTDLYTELAARTGARVLVNSSKWPGDPGLLGLLPPVDPFAVHLVRDPRAVAHSWTRHKAPDDPRAGHALRQDRVAVSAAGWVAKNLASEVSVRRLGPDHHLLLRYEDLTADPARELARLADLVGEPPPPDDFLERCATTPAVNHTVGGNPDRLGRDRLRLARDDRWIAEMDERARVEAALVSAPLLRRYGYPVRVRPAVPA
jgi:hypothetical protein